MNAASRPVLPQQHRSRRPTASSRVTSLPSPYPETARTGVRGVRSQTVISSTFSSMPSRITGQKVAQINASRPMTPGWMRSLLFLQRSSDIVAFLLVAATLTIYSWTVYTQQQWAKEYRKLETLQRNERHLTTANEVMKDQLAQQAEIPATGLVTPNRSNAIFLPPAPQRQPHTPPTQTADSESAATTPLGY